MLATTTGHIMNLNLRPLLVSSLLTGSILISTVCDAIEVIRADFEFQGNNHPVDIALFDNISGGTVSNFLSYVDDGSYNNLLINRSVPGFVIQAGAYTFDPAIGDGSFSYDGNDQFSGGLQLVPSKGEITNEFKLSNLRGTLAMARVGGEVDSANNQWFINLTDNDFLDTVDEGFTVFGEVLGNGMDSVDLVSAIPVFPLFSETDLTGSFLSVPLVDYLISSTISDITKNNLVIINSFDRLFNITDIIDVGDAVINTTIQKDVVIQNNNIAAMQIGTIDTSSLAAPFSILSNPCQNTTLQLAEQCIVQIEFSPVSTDFFASSFNVEITTYGYTFPVLLKTPAPEIVATPTVAEFGIQPVYDPADGFPEQRVIRINNRGDRTLNISSVTFDTQFTNEFEFIDNCTANSAHPPGTVPPGELCIVIVNFLPADLSEKSAIISVVSDDPINGQIDIQVTGGASSDNDGIENAIEDAAPNGGDGNIDDIPDRLQNNVVSFPAANGIYTTLVTDEDVLFTNVKPVQLSTIEALPDGVSLDNEAFAFELSGFTAGSIAEFGLILPAGHTPANIYSFGPTADNNTPHWYTLEKNTIPGVIIFGDVSLLASSGESVSRNVSTIRILDGGDGDSDQLVNGKILFVGGPEINNQSSSSSGALLWMLFLIPFSILIYRNNKTAIAQT